MLKLDHFMTEAGCQLAGWEEAEVRGPRAIHRKHN